MQRRPPYPVNGALGGLVIRFIQRMLVIQAPHTTFIADSRSIVTDLWTNPRRLEGVRLPPCHDGKADQGRKAHADEPIDRPTRRRPPALLHDSGRYISPQYHSTGEASQAKHPHNQVIWPRVARDNPKGINQGDTHEQNKTTRAIFFVLIGRHFSRRWRAGIR